jgi:alpha-tubulin suppressor-like RCC1 family protein
MLGAGVDSAVKVEGWFARTENGSWIRYRKNSDKATTENMKDVKQISAGGHHACAVMGNGTVRCWGANFGGAVGVPEETDTTEPVEVPGVADVLEVEAGFYHTCALKRDGTVTCWGKRRATGGSDERPYVIPGLKGVVQLAAGSDFTCAVVSDRTVRCWGLDSWGRLGDGSPPSRDRNLPSPVLSLQDVVQITAGAQHACALLESGAVMCWGTNFDGELGCLPSVDADCPEFSPIPKLVSNLSK